MFLCVKYQVGYTKKLTLQCQQPTVCHHILIAAFARGEKTRNAESMQTVPAFAGTSVLMWEQEAVV